MIEISPIASIKNGFSTKFGIPRQSGLVKDILSTIVFEPQYRNPDAIRGLEGTTHIWLIWYFSEAHRGGFSPTVRPPRFGGNRRVGVFATRSPFRPNPLGLSCVKVEEILLQSANGPMIIVSGADLMDNTPIFDIKPYIPYADSLPEAKCPLIDTNDMPLLEVEIPNSITNRYDSNLIQSISEILQHDPRPRFHTDPNRVYRFEYGGYTIQFKVNKDRAMLLSLSKI